MPGGMSFSQIVMSVCRDNAIVGAVSSSILIILLGFLLAKKNIIDEKLSKGLSVIILSVGLPALSFTSFMQDINTQTLRQGMSILVWSFLFQGGLIFVSRLYYYRYSGDRRNALSVITTLGSTTFFGIPIIAAIYGKTGVLYASIFNIAYRIYLYSWGFITFSGLKMNRANIKNMICNPIILGTFIGLFIWLLQAYLPQVAVVSQGQAELYACLRIDKTAFWLYKPLTYLASLSSPLVWLSIGATLGRISLKKALTDATSWFYSITKTIFVPLLCIACLCVLNLFIDISFLTVAVSTIMMATPPATVAVAYAIKFEKEALLASSCSLIGTIFAVFTIPTLILVLELIRQIHVFS